MHALSSFIEDNGTLDVLCPRCGLEWDAVKMLDLTLGAGDVDAYIKSLGVDADVSSAESQVEDDGLSPIARLFANNGQAMDDTFEQFGAAYVANWFFSLAASIAARYNLTPTEDEENPYQEVTEVQQ